MQLTDIYCTLSMDALRPIAVKHKHKDDPYTIHGNIEDLGEHTPS